MVKVLGFNLKIPSVGEIIREMPKFIIMFIVTSYAVSLLNTYVLSKLGVRIPFPSVS